MRADAFLGGGVLPGFLWTLARVSGVFAFLPLGAFSATPAPVKAVLSLGFTAMLWPLWRAQAAPVLSTAAIVAGMAGEAALGMAIGITVAIALELFSAAAQMVSLQAGFGFASTIDPTSGADSTALITVAQVTAGLLFFAVGGERALVRVLADSFRLCPPPAFVMNSSWVEAITRFSSTIFSAGLRLAAPVVALLLLADFSLAVLGRLQAQVQLVTLTMPVKLLATLLVLAATMTFYSGFLNTSLTQAVRLMEGMLRSAR
ncbi:MAG TPA: flagellar biosynthetic protein FliR [Bryobacteraceae bacterium]|nr:flagellar biosynthetic protein FliR [Bryobacteraceae bacterium]